MPEKEIPEEINDHLKLFGKDSWEVDYGEKCPLCNVRIDEYDMCDMRFYGRLEYFLPDNYGRIIIPTNSLPNSLNDTLSLEFLFLAYSVCSIVIYYG